MRHLKKGRVGVDSYGGRRTTLKCLRLTREFLFKVVKDSSYPPIAVVEKAKLFNYVECNLHKYSHVHWPNKKEFQFR